MGKRESTVLASQAGPVLERLARGPGGAVPPHHDDEPPAAPRRIGDLVRQVRGLSEQQVGQVMALQRQRPLLRFGEAAVALGLASEHDVLWALSQQHAYSYARSGDSGLGAELVLAREPFSRQAEHFRRLRSRLLAGVLAPHPARRALAVASADRGDGKTYFAANLAVALSQLGARTLLIDADLRTPRLHSLFGLPGDSGLSNVLARRQQGAPSILAVESLPGLFVMPAGTLPPNPVDLVQRSTLDALLQEMAGAFEHVLVDTPAACHGADGAVIAGKAGAALLVARRHASRLAPLQELLRELAERPVALAGVLVNER